VEAIKEDYREGQGLPFFDGLQPDLCYAVRQVRRAPFVTAMATLSLAIGIGANAAIFTLVDRVLLQSLPVSDPHELVFVTDQRSRRERSPRFSYPFYATLRDTTALNGVAARFVLPVNVSTDEQAVRPRGELVSGNYFSLLGAGMQLGRPLTAADDLTPGAHPVAVISDGFWRRNFESDPAVLGRSVRINNHTFTIIGIAAPGFTGTEVGLPTDVWLPMMMQREVGRDLLTSASTNWVEMIGRLKSGVSLERAGDELTAYLDSREQATPAPLPGGERRRLMLLPGDKGNSPARRELGPALRVLIILTALALVLTCINVASLLVVRSVAREKEIAVRLALGARRSHLIRQCLAETLVLAALGGTAGLLMAPWAVGLLVASQPYQQGLDASVDMRVFMFGIAAWIVTGLLVGLAPILASTKVGLAQVSSNQAAAMRGLRRRATVHDVIVACQIAVSLVMLIGAGLFVQSLQRLSSLEPGFRADHLLLISADPGSAGYDAHRLERFWRDTLDRVGQVRGVQSVSLAKLVPLAPGRQRQPVFNVPLGQSLEIDTNAVGPRYFYTLGIPLLRGREFGEEDGKTSRPVVIVNERMAQMYWPNQDPLGKEMPVGPPGAPLAEIVGIVKDAKYRDLREDAGPMLYLPAFQRRSTDALTLHVRATSDPRALAGTIRREMQALDAQLPVFGVRTLEDQLDGFFAPTRQAAVLTGGFGILALLLSGIGVYGVTALAVSRQTQDIGIRMALGAEPHQIAFAMGRRGISLVVVGLTLGLVVSAAFTRIATALLYGVTATDSATFAAMSALLAVVSLTAIYIPARAATRVDAITAIRCS
jgi:predicted permease